MGIWTSAFFCGLWVLTWLPLVCIVRVIWISTNHVSFNVIAQGDERERKRGVIQKGLNPPTPPPPPPPTPPTTPNSLHPSLFRGKRGGSTVRSCFLASCDPSFTLPCPSASVFIVYLLNEGGGAAPAWLTAACGLCRRCRGGSVAFWLRMLKGNRRRR